MSLHYLVKLEILIGQVLYHWVVTRRNSRICSSSTVTPLICQIWIQLITAWGTIAREGVQNTHHYLNNQSSTISENYNAPCSAVSLR